MNNNNLAERLASLSPEKREALLRKLQEQKKSQPAKASQNAIVPVDRNSTRIPLSYAQQRLWFLDKLDTGTAFYNISAAIELSGELDVEALRQAIEAIIYRHEALRTVFIEEEDEACQRVMPAGTLVLPMQDLSAKAPEIQDEKVSRIIRAEAAAPFDLSSGPLLRSSLLRLSAKRHILLTTMHHIISDGWSSAILLKEISELYTAFKRGQPSSLPELSIQYADYAHWQRQTLTEEYLRKQVDYWRDQLKGVEVLELPSDRPRGPNQSHIGKHLTFRLEQPLLESLTKISKNNRATLFMTLLAIFKVLLYRYSNQTDICVGSPIANRTRTDIEPLIGFFVNSLALRTSLHGDPSFNQLLSRVEKVTIDAYANQDVPFEQLVDALVETRDPSHNPLFQTFFSLINGKTERSLSLPGLEVNFIPAEIDAAKFDLSLNCTEYSDHVSCELEYSTDLFDHSTMARLAQHFVTLAECIAHNPDLPVSQLELLDAEERRLLIRDWNQNKAAVEKTCVHQLIENRVKRTPNAIAVSCGNDNISYQNLNNRANQWARHLRSLGIRQGERVGICLKPSLNYPIAILATLKAGAAYIPLDSSYPEDRIEHMLSNAKVDVVLTESSLIDKISNDAITTLMMDQPAAELEQLPVGNLDCVNTPEDLLYVVYTSGSTGAPKGAMVSHRNEVNLLNWYTSEYAITEQDRVLVISAMGFDLTQKNLFAPLVRGARLVFPTSERYDNLVISETIRREGITLLNCAPSAFYPLVESSADFSELSSLRLVLFGGEPIKVENLLRWTDHKNCRASIVNMYGPTECTDIAASHRLDKPRQYLGKNIPIGRPNTNVELYVLDDYHQPVPVGVIGELYIGGAGVGGGYLFNDSLTAEKFRPNPFGEGRLYQTGDLVRYRADGLLEFVSRKDGQIKIRGFRIELGEIEVQLARHPAIKQGVASTTTTATGCSVLTAYYVTEADVTPDHTELRNTLKQSLPEYMVPLAFTRINEVPLTPNGKVNRKALPEPDLSEFVNAPFIAPRNETEQALADIWSTVLKLDRIGVHDDFFEAGGHSLLATQLVTRIRNVFGVEIPLRGFFEITTIAEIAVLINSLQAMNQQGDDQTHELQEDDDFDEGVL